MHVSESELAQLKQLADRREELSALLAKCSDHWGYEDTIYRFYHQSFTVFALQDQTAKIVEVLRSLSPLALDRWFEHIDGALLSLYGLR